MGKIRTSNKHLPRRVYFKNGGYYFVDKQNKWHYLSRSMPEAMAIWAKKFASHRKIITMAELIDRYLMEIAPLKAVKSYKDNIGQAKPLKDVFGKMEPADITPVHVYAYIDKRAQKAPVAANREKALLSHIFSMAIRWGIVGNNPCKDVKRNPEKKRDRYIEDWEFEAVKSIAGSPMSAIMDFAYLTGLRKGDILNLRITDITTEGIKIQTKKTGAKVIIEMTDELKKCLDKAKKARRAASFYVFCNTMGTGYTSDGFNTIWQRLLKRALSAGLIKERFHFHDIRRKSATDADRLHGREYARQLLTHENQKMTAGYISGYQKVKPLK